MKSEEEIMSLLPFAGDYNATQEHEDNIIGEKIRNSRKALGLTLKEFSIALEKYGLSISDKGINKWENGMGIPNAYQLMAVCLALGITELPDLTKSLRPPLNEIGMEKIRAYTADLIATGKYASKPKQKAEIIEFMDLKLALLPASAGTGQFLDSDNFDTIHLPRHTVPVGTDFAIHIAGDSMEPIYQDGQMVFVESTQHVPVGDVGIFLYDGNCYIKEYREQTPEDDDLNNYTDSSGIVHKQPVLISYNEAYSPIVISPELEFRTIGRILH